MNRMFLRSTFLTTAVLTFLGGGCTIDAPTPTTAPRVIQANLSFYSNVPTRFKGDELRLVDYSARSSAAAVEFVDVPGTGITVNTVTTPANIAGPTFPGRANGVAFVLPGDPRFMYPQYVTFGFDQLLVGAQVQTVNVGNHPTTGDPFIVGQGDYAGSFNVITGYTGLPVTTVTADGVAVTTARTDYQPSGGWTIDPTEPYYNNPPPAITVNPAVFINSANPATWTGFTPGSTVIVHLMAETINGVSGLPLPAAVNASGARILLGGDPTLPVAATVVFVMPLAAPSAVTAVAGANSGEADVSWTAPASSGTNAVIGYTVTAHPALAGAATGGVSVVSPNLTGTVTGLTPGVSYTFTVTTFNGSTSNPSSSSAPLTIL